VTFDAPPHLRTPLRRPANLVPQRDPGTDATAPHGRTVEAAETRKRAPRPPRLDLDAALGNAAPDRLTLAVAAYLLLPGLLFLADWAELWVGPVAAAAGAGALLLSPGWRRSWPLGLGATLLCLALGLLWAAPTGTHHFVYSVADWQIRDAVLRDLSAGPWPVAYEGGGGRWLLRAPLGFFLPAGLVGRLAGFGAAQVALAAWAALGLGLALALLATLAHAIAPGRPRRAFALVAAVFAGFHGMDILPNIWLDWSAGAGALASWGRGGEWWARLFQYSGHVTALLWAPNHAVPAWLVSLLVLRHWRRPAFARGAALPLAAGVFWSPIGVAGAGVLAGAALLRAGGARAALRASLAPANLLAAGFALPLCLYLVVGTEAVPHGWVVSLRPPLPATGRWALFLLLEVLCWAGLAALLVRGWLFGASVAMLCLLPAYVFGPGNEMTSRGGLAPLAVLAVAVAAALLAPALSRIQRIARAGLLACAALAAAGSAAEFSLLIVKPAWPASERCSVPEAARQSVFRNSTDWSHYLAPWPDEALDDWIEEADRRPVPPANRSPPCWPRGGV
jgi:hypothetical protein